MSSIATSIQSKILLGLTTLLCLVLIALPVTSTVIAYQDSIKDERVNLTKQVVGIAYSIILNEHRLELAGTKSRKQAQHDALDAISRIKYNDGGYVWVNDFSFTMLQHPTTNLIGKNAANVVDASGKHVFHEFMKVSEATGEGYIEYKWNRPHYPPHITFDKMSSIKRFNQWQWVIGAGVYVYDTRHTVLRHTISYFMLLNGTLVLVIGLVYVWGRHVRITTQVETKNQT